MSDLPVLALTSLDDPTSDVVITELNLRSVPVIRCDLAASSPETCTWRPAATTAGRHATSRPQRGSRTWPVSDRSTTDANGSYAWLTSDDGAWTVTQGGSGRLWDDIEYTIVSWREAGQPPQHDFTVSVTPTRHAVTLSTEPREMAWELASEPGATCPS